MGEVNNMTNPYNDYYEQVSIKGVPALFTMLTIDKGQLPSHLYCYDVRHGSDNNGMAVEVRNSVMINHMGSIITKEQIELNKHDSLMLSKDDFEFMGNHRISLNAFIDDSYLKPNDTIDVVIIEPLREPYHTTIENTLTALQQKVGGYIEIVSPLDGDNNACVICNEEGKLKGLPLNRQIGNDIIAGTFIVAGLKEDIASLTEKQIEQYKERFKDIEVFGFSLDLNKDNKGHFER
jgi:hypothetical protein